MLVDAVTAEVTWSVLSTSFVAPAAGEVEVANRHTTLLACEEGEVALCAVQPQAHATYGGRRETHMHH